MCQRTFTERRNLLRHVRTQHAGHWTCSRCSATFTREDNFTYHQRTCEFRATGKRPAPTQFGGGAPKRQRTTNAQWRAQALNRVMDEYSVNLEEVEQSPETILNVLKNAVLDLEEAIKRDLEQKRAIKVTSIVRFYSLHSADCVCFLKRVLRSLLRCTF